LPDALPPLNAAVLVGNGLSIAFNSELNLAAITKEMIARMESASEDGDKVVHAMNEIARRAVSEGEVTDEDFEKLVGAFDSQALTLEELGKLAELVENADADLHDAIREVSKFSARVRDRGISYVLEVVMERSRSDRSLHADLHESIRAIVDHFHGNVSFGNLNYDTLLLSTLLTIEAPLTDMAHGFSPVPMRVIDTATGEVTAVATYVGHRLRTALDFPQGDRYRVRLVHLHGSLTFWGQVDGDIHVKVPIESLRSHGMWSGLRDGSPKWRPSVVLANQRDKAHHIGKYPFKVSYEAFAQSLAGSNHWLIIGYSFRDACVNDMLRNEFLKRRTKPSVLVSTFGDFPTRLDIEIAFGWGAEDAESRWLQINREGASGLQNTWEWAVFTYMPED
jgi:hypothetical protein